LQNEPPRFLLCSDNQALGARLGAALKPLGAMEQTSPRAEEISALFAQACPALVFLDFLEGEEQPQRELACQQAGELERLFPEIPTIAVGRITDPTAAISAFRSGVRDFVDHENNADLLETVERLLRQAAVPAATAPNAKASARGGVLLLGARAGMGVSTLAVQLAGMLQQRLNSRLDADEDSKKRVPAHARPLTERVCLLDLGMPVGDGLLYLGIRHGFHFVDAVQNLRRLDDTLLSSALPHDDDGISVLALPRSLDQVRDASQTDSVALFKRLHGYFAQLITDTGGLANPAFIAALAQHNAHVWVVADQSLSGLVSLADLLHELDEHKVDRAKLRLVVNRYDPRYGMHAGQIAERFDLKLLGTLPDRSLSLHKYTNLGKLLFKESPSDPYVKALEVLARELDPENQTPDRRRHAPQWLSALLRR